ncbi:3-oxoacyl-ACP synthase [Streptomyces sp. OspMP-M43]|uniref:3-oxoacyl-ACP synthase n=1 Tax=Streptomyces sp. OspMP-M43 TaxID=1839781 RepID=UPI00081BAAF8|nr:3-oxoacyl-ACP synthase [Streptomyces sp. OspMP-M43]SCE23116.1 3-oxoacyl-[acyl-carrier-protein] synthase-3 [Streptomyces sp. OspMP-M43]
MGAEGAFRTTAPRVAINAVGRHLPDRPRPLAHLPELAGLDEAERLTCRGLGIDTVAVDDGLTAVGLAERAARDALDTAGIPAAALGALILVEPRAPETLISSDATRLQYALGADTALTFSVGGLGCVSSTPALLTARGLLAADPGLGPVLVVHGSKPAAARRYRHPVTVNGDSGLALVLGRPNAAAPVHLLDLVQRTNGRYWDLFGLEYRDRPTVEWREKCSDPPGYSFRLAMETRNRLAELVAELLARNGLTGADIAGYASQNLSAGSLAFIEESLDIALLPACRDNLRALGHLGANDTFLNLSTALARKELAEGDLAVLINVSPVAAWSVLLVETGPTSGPGSIA